MRNIEIKARCPDPEATGRLLEQRGLERVARMHQVDTYFVVPHGRLKLREMEGEAAQLIQYARPDLLAAHASDYLIAPASDPSRLKEVLTRALGIRVVVDKQRDLYLWEHTRIHLDEVAGLGSFLELETVITDQTHDEAERECREVQAALRITEEDLVAGSYSDHLAREQG
jgi:predicted adenylyl cyclase CyaB